MRLRATPSPLCLASSPSSPTLVVSPHPLLTPASLPCTGCTFPKSKRRTLARRFSRDDSSLRATAAARLDDYAHATAPA